MSLLRQRRSVRHFSERELSRDEVRALLDEARFAPSGGNDQPWSVTALAPGACAQLRADYEDRAWRALLPKVEAMVRRSREDSAVPTGSSLFDEARARIDSFGRVRGRPWALLVHCSPAPSLVPREDEGSREMLLRVEPLVRRDSVVCFAFALTLAGAARGIASCMQSMYRPWQSAILRAAGAPAGDELVSVVLLGRAEIPEAPPRTPLEPRWVERFGVAARPSETGLNTGLAGRDAR